MGSPWEGAVEELVLPLSRLRGPMRGPPALVVAGLVLPRPSRISDSKIMGLRVAELVLPPWPPGPSRALRVPPRRVWVAVAGLVLPPPRTGPSP